MALSYNSSKNKPTYTGTPRKNLVLGTAGLGGAWKPIDPEESVATILYAIQNGIHRIDTAPAYDMAEEIVGKAIRKLNRKKTFISTKVGKLKGKASDAKLNDYRLDVMKDSIAQSMERLMCNKIDLLFLHEPEKVPVHQIEEVVLFLEQLKRNNKVSYLGFGGIPPKSYWPYMKKGLFDVVMGYNNLDACCFDGLHEDIPFYKKNNINIYQASLLHMGLLGNRYEKYIRNPPEWISKNAVENAILLKDLAKRSEIYLPTLAHRFALSVKEIDWIVLGPRNMEQLKKSIEDVAKGPLDRSCFRGLIALHK